MNRCRLRPSGHWQFTTSFGNVLIIRGRFRSRRVTGCAVPLLSRAAARRDASVDTSGKIDIGVFIGSCRAAIPDQPSVVSPKYLYIRGNGFWAEARRERRACPAVDL